MAIQSGVIQFRGKLGKVVGRANGNQSLTSVANKASNVLAALPEVVSNPMTARQAAQRLRMRPAVNFYRELGYILNHSWQGTKYRSASRNKFMQQALQSSDIAIPFLKKGDNSFVPGEYPLSTGSLAGVDIVGIEEPYVITSLSVDRFNENSSVGANAQMLIDRNAGLLAGDKLTFVVAVAHPKTDGGLSFSTVALQWVLNPDDTLNFADWLKANKLLMRGTDYMLFGIADYGYKNAYVAAAAVIQTRVPASNGGDYQRSTSQFYVIDSVLNQYMSADAYNAALASYQGKNVEFSSEWYLNNGTFETLGVGGSRSLVGQYTFAEIGLYLPSYGSLPRFEVPDAAIAAKNGQLYVFAQAGTGRPLTWDDNAVGQHLLYVYDEYNAPSYVERAKALGFGVITSDEVSSLGLTFEAESARP